MTCIVGIATPGKGALIGFDSLAGGGGTYEIRQDPKGAKLTPWLALGYTTSYRFGQILTGYLDVNSISPTAPADPYEWALKVLVPQIRTILGEHGWLEKSNERESAGCVLFAIRDRIIGVHTDLQVFESAAGYNSVGSGEDIAKGALYALKGERPRRAATLALEAAEAGSVYVKRPWHFLETKA